MGPIGVLRTRPIVFGLLMFLVYSSLLTPPCGLATGLAVDSMQDQDLGADCIPDISDMIDYDPVSQTSARCELIKKERQRAKLLNEEKLHELEQQLEACLQERGQGSHELQPPPPAECSCHEAAAVTCPDTSAADDMFFRRLTRHLVNVLEEEAHDSGAVQAQVEVALTSHEWKKLKNFVNDKEIYRKADIHDILVGMTMGVFHVNETSVVEWLGEQINFKSPGIILLLVSVSVMTVVFGFGMYSDLYWNRRFCGCLMTTIFLISLLWNWIYLYQEEVIKRYRSAQKFEGIPASCMPHQMTWVQTLGEWFSSMTSVRRDECFEYNRNYLVDPLFDIPPTRALAFTLSTMFIDPMKYLGRAVSEFHAEIFRDLPLWGALPALFSCYIFMFVVLYAYIAAPRRVLRPQPQGQGRWREGPPQPAIGHRPRRGNQNAPIEDEAADDDDDFEGGERVENIHPPTLPPKHREEPKPSRVRRRSPEENVSQGPLRDHQEDIAEVSVQPLQRQDQGPPNEPGPSSLSPSKSSLGATEDTGLVADPVVRPTTSLLGRQPPNPDGSRVPSQVTSRPTEIGDLPSTTQTASPGRSAARTIGDTDAGKTLSHPECEMSECESLSESMVRQREMEVEENVEEENLGLQGASVGTLATTPVPPSPLESPDDISIISQSPENTNSASYDFISTSCFKLAEGTTEAELDATENIRGQHEVEDSDDDFVVLKKESK